MPILGLIAVFLASLQFDRIAEINLGVMELVVSIIHDPEASGLFPNSFAVAHYRGIDKSVVTESIRSKITAFQLYLLDRWDYTLRLPWAFSLLLHPIRSRTTASWLLNKISEVETTDANSEERRLWKAHDPIGFLGNEERKGALQVMAGGGEMDMSLYTTIVEVFGSYSVGQAYSELEVKVGKVSDRSTGPDVTSLTLPPEPSPRWCSARGTRTRRP